MITIQTATLENIDQLCSLLVKLFEQEADFTPNIEAHKRGLKMIISSPNVGKIITLKFDGKIIGMIGLLFSISTAIGTKAATFEDFIIAPEYRRKGYGKQLFEYAVKEAKASGCQRITLLTDNNNLKAHSFYKQQGMEMSAMVPFKKMI